MTSQWILPVAVLAGVMFAAGAHGAEPADTNYDESKVPAYDLPELLVTKSGQVVRTASDWRENRRPEILRLFEDTVYGRTPVRQVDVQYEVVERDDQAFDGLATRKQIRATFAGQLIADMLVYVPHHKVPHGKDPHGKVPHGKAGRDDPAPAFLGLNFYGNQTIADDPAILINPRWMRGNAAIGIRANRATEETRGAYRSRWQVETVLKRGYALATVYCGDFDPDNYRHDFTDGVHPLFYEGAQTTPASNEWGAIGAWAWGLSRTLDYLETDSDIDATRVAVLGHSRLGKTALWAGAQDERFSLVISNNSGCGGAALYRRCFGERIHHMIKPVGYWFCDEHRQYQHREHELPVDQHMLLALVAPRPLYVASAAKDQWADPRGEFLAAKHASKVYALLGQSALEGADFPPSDQPLTTTVGYHLRSGEHDVTAFDWAQYLDFADRHWKTRD